MHSDRLFLVVLISVFGLLSALILLPFAQYVMIAVVLGYVLYPVQRRLERHVNGSVAAGILIVASTVAILLPFAVLVGVAVEQAVDVARMARAGAIDFSGIEAAIAQTTGMAVDIEATAAEVQRYVADLLRGPGQGETTELLGSALSVFGGLSDLLIGVTVLLFLLYYFLKDGDRLVAWVRRVTPLSPRIQDELYAATDRVMWSVLVGNVLVGVVQGVLTGVGLAIAGFDNVVFWTVMTAILALLPLIGASVVWFPASVFLLLSGQTVSGAFLFVYGAAVVSVSDNYLRPVLSSRGAALSPGVVIVGIFGGIYALGVMGLFFGPLVLGVFKTLVNVYAREYGRG